MTKRQIPKTVVIHECGDTDMMQIEVRPVGDPAGGEGASQLEAGERAV